MARLRRRKIGNKRYYYLEHSYKIGSAVKTISRYLGIKKPENIKGLKKEIKCEAMRKIWGNTLAAIQKGYAKQLKALPNAAKDKQMESFMVNFIFNSNKIEGSKLSFRDTAGLFIHGTTPKNKPIKDVKEAEGHKKAFFDMLGYKGSISLEKVISWHKMIFENSEPIIAGKIRLHKIEVTGSRASFPHPESVNSLLNKFFLWYHENLPIFRMPKRRSLFVHNKNKRTLNPVELAALAHLKFVSIHPFTDGNGRISRLLANCALYTSTYPLINIKYLDRLGYYRSLETSQIWYDDTHFVRFFVKKYINANKKYITSK